MNNEAGGRNEIPDLRSTFYTYLAMPRLDDPQGVHREALEALDGYMDEETLFEAALPLFHKLRMPLPRIPIIVGTLNDPEIAEREAGYILRVLADTKSVDVYRNEMNSLLERFPNLKSIFSGF